MQKPIIIATTTAKTVIANNTSINIPRELRTHFMINELEISLKEPKDNDLGNQNYNTRHRNFMRKY